MSTAKKKAAGKAARKQTKDAKPGALTITPAQVRKLHKALRDAGFASHSLKSIKLQPSAAADGCHMVCTPRPDGTLDCRMVCP